VTKNKATMMLISLCLICLTTDAMQAILTEIMEWVFYKGRM